LVELLNIIAEKSQNPLMLLLLSTINYYKCASQGLVLQLLQMPICKEKRHNFAILSKEYQAS